MKKRMILTNSLIAFFALLVMLLISAGIVMVSNKEASHRQVRKPVPFMTVPMRQKRYKL